MIDKILRFLRGTPAVAEVALDSDPRFICFLPEENPMGDADELRREAAMSLMDEDTYGFMLLRVVRVPTPAAVGEVTVLGLVPPLAWPAVRLTLERCAEVGAERG